MITFRAEKPITGITEITVTNFDANTIRIIVTGAAGIPVVDLFDSDEGLIFGFTPVVTSAQTPQIELTPPAQQPEQPSTQGDEQIEIVVVTGEQEPIRLCEISLVQFK
jgi:iron complex outermembrane receptor protein